ncbi:hypothetical protein ES332_D11G238800v1 [Gossypium tomentosum]|uniref:Uncharacterized protein n=1 Tax=Gossypium tomentosum TaxID=34277 RepID=A0A5D2IRT2_GOSTO|nr:hypothetical protein ES332_D11G238800v1 [Gossypium tomentosum]
MSFYSTSSLYSPFEFSNRAPMFKNSKNPKIGTGFILQACIFLSWTHWRIYFQGKEKATNLS